MQYSLKFFNFEQKTIVYQVSIFEVLYNLLNVFFPKIIFKKI